MLYGKKNKLKIANDNLLKLNRFYLDMLTMFNFNDDEVLRDKTIHLILKLKSYHIKEIVLSNLIDIDVDDIHCLSKKNDDIIVNLSYYINEYWKKKYGQDKF